MRLTGQDPASLVVAPAVAALQVDGGDVEFSSGRRRCPPPRAADIFFDKGPIFPGIAYLATYFLDPNFDGSCDYHSAFGEFHGYPCEGDAAGDMYAHPDFCFPCGSGRPHEVNRAALDVASYGVQEQQQVPGNSVVKPPTSSRWTGSGIRMGATTELVAGPFRQSDEFLRYTENDGGTCFGDSGGPDLIGGTDTVLAVNSTVSNYNCAGVVGAA